jgi:predicted nucleotidyltransferase
MREIDNVIVMCYGGSMAYGTNIATSDIDVRGIFCADEKSVRTPFFNIREVDLEDQEDGKLYELTNFMKLYVDMNPNILELLWVDDKSIITSTPEYEHLRSYRKQLLSTKCAFTFTGYAMQQMKRIKGHNKWINKPQPRESPVRMDYFRLIHNYGDDKLLPREFNIKDFQDNHLLIPYGSDIYAVIEHTGGKLFNKDGSLRKASYDDLTLEQKKHKPLFIAKLCEAEFKQAKDDHTNYWRWVNNRNETRHELEEKYGLDTKHAMHIVRLMRMGEEILRDGVVNVMRPDAKELLDIRNGKWSYEELLRWAEEKDHYVRDILYKQSSLPKQVDLKLAAKVLMEVQDMCWSK